MYFVFWYIYERKLIFKDFLALAYILKFNINLCRIKFIMEQSESRRDEATRTKAGFKPKPKCQNRAYVCGNLPPLRFFRPIGPNYGQKPIYKSKISSCDWCRNVQSLVQLSHNKFSQDSCLIMNPNIGTKLSQFLGRKWTYSYWQLYAWSLQLMNIVGINSWVANKEWQNYKKLELQAWFNRRL